MVLSISCSHKGHMTYEGNITCHGCVETIQFIYVSVVTLSQDLSVPKSQHLCTRVEVCVCVGGRGEGVCHVKRNFDY